MMADKHIKYTQDSLFHSVLIQQSIATQFVPMKAFLKTRKKSLTTINYPNSRITSALLKSLNSQKGSAHQEMSLAAYILTSLQLQSDPSRFWHQQAYR